MTKRNGTDFLQDSESDDIGIGSNHEDAQVDAGQTVKWELEPPLGYWSNAPYGLSEYRLFHSKNGRKWKVFKIDPELDAMSAIKEGMTRQCESEAGYVAEARRLAVESLLAVLDESGNEDNDCEATPIAETNQPSESNLSSQSDFLRFFDHSLIKWKSYVGCYACKFVLNGRTYEVHCTTAGAKWRIDCDGKTIFYSVDGGMPDEQTWWADFVCWFSSNELSISSRRPFKWDIEGADSRENNCLVSRFVVNDIMHEARVTHYDDFNISVITPNTPKQSWHCVFSERPKSEQPYACERRLVDLGPRLMSALIECERAATKIIEEIKNRSLARRHPTGVLYLDPGQQWPPENPVAQDEAYLGSQKTEENKLSILKAIRDASPHALHVSIMKKSTGISPKTMEMYLSALIEDGKIVREERGYYRLPPMSQDFLEHVGFFTNAEKTETVPVFIKKHPHQKNDIPRVDFP